MLYQLAQEGRGLFRPTVANIQILHGWTCFSLFLLVLFYAREKKKQLASLVQQPARGRVRLYNSRSRYLKSDLGIEYGRSTTVHAPAGKSERERRKVFCQKPARMRSCAIIANCSRLRCRRVETNGLLKNRSSLRVRFVST